MKINTLDDAKHLLWQYKQPLIWIESSAFWIFFPWIFFPNFEIITYKNSLDTDLLSKQYKIKKLNTLIPWKIWRISILKDEEIQNYIKSQEDAYIITHKETSRFEKLIFSLWKKMLGNSSSIRKIYENKKKFREILKEIWITPIVGKNVDIDYFLDSSYKERSALYGDSLVIQFPDIIKWGGSGTLFIHNKEDFFLCQKSIAFKTYRSKKINSVNVTKFITGISTSSIGCATKYGTFTSTIQTQIIDIPDVISNKKWSWLFCWHDRSFKKYSPIIQQKSDIIMQKIWNHMYKNWYKWIFWLDLIIDEADEVYVIECNSRYTLAMPMLSMLHIQNNCIPMDAFHLLEHLNLEYTVDFNKINQSYKKDIYGSHIILSNTWDSPILCKKELASGVYLYKNNELLFQRPWYQYSDIHHDDEFIITDGNPRKWQIIKWYKESCKICHLLFPIAILADSKNLQWPIKKIIQTIYKELF